MLFQSLLYCSNSCTSLLYRTCCFNLFFIVPTRALHCCTVHVVSISSLLFQLTHFTVVPCMLFQLFFIVPTHALHCCTVHVVSISSLLFQLTHFTVVPCMLFQSLLYCSNSWISLHFKTLISHTKTFKIGCYMFRSPLKPSSGDPWPYFAKLLNWNLLIYIRYKECRFLAVC
jgi:hypothetical protein